MPIQAALMFGFLVSGSCVVRGFARASHDSDIGATISSIVSFGSEL